MTNNEKYENFSKMINQYLFDSKEELSGKEKEIASIGFTEIEINSGGFKSFFEHSTTKTRQEIYVIYEKIGEIKCLDILKQFQAILDRFPKDTEFQDIDFNKPEFNETDFDEISELDEKYWEISEEVFVLAYDYYMK